MVLSMGREEIKDRERDKREENNCLGKKKKEWKPVISERITFKRWEITSEIKRHKEKNGNEA